MNVCCHDWPFSSKLLCVTLWHSKQIYDVCGRHMYMAFCEESSRRWNCVFVPKAKPIKLMGCRITDGTNWGRYNIPNCPEPDPSCSQSRVLASRATNWNHSVHAAICGWFQKLKEISETLMPRAMLKKYQSRIARDRALGRRYLSQPPVMYPDE